MTAHAEAVVPTVLVAEARVQHSERLTPAFVRVTLESPQFVDLGIDGFDTRFKIVFPGPTGELPTAPGEPEEWYAQWMSMPEETRSPMRTYTVRDVLVEADVRALVVDLFVHEHGPQGPACRWALTARPGDVVHVVVPHRASQEYGGTEFAPDSRRDLLLVADETALPAVTRILADLEPGFTGQVFVEVPTAEDRPALEVPEGFELCWLTRGSAPQGRRLVEEVRRFLGLGALDPGVLPAELPSDLDVEVWETPRHSSSGEDLTAPARRVSEDLDSLYAWIAGESWLVKALRRSLVNEVGVNRTQVAFMGYWREGVSMKS